MTKFNFIYSTIIDETKHVSYILDSNVLIGLSKLYYNKFKDKDELDSYLDLYNYLSNKDVISGPAIAELSWDYENHQVDMDKKNKLFTTIDNLFINNKFQNVNNRSHHSKMSFTNLYDNADANHYLLPSLCLMKKFSILLNERLENKETYEKLIVFINNELKLTPAYELALITYFLFSPQNEWSNKLKKLFKIKSKYMIDDKNIWNGCWDIFFIRLVNELPSRNFSNETVSNIYNVCLITSDAALSDFSNNILDRNKQSSTYSHGLIMPCIDIDPKEFKLDDYDFIEKKYNILSCSISERTNYLNSIDQVKHYKNLLKSLY